MLLIQHHLHRTDVSQGYRGPPTDFVKAQSTGTIFRSMNDTIRHAHSNLSTPYGQNRDSSKKRSRSVESDEQDGGQEAESGCLAHSSSNLHATTAATRPTKPLRFSKSKFVRPPSLPTGSSSFADPRHMTETKEVAEEEDWSLNMSSEATEQRFEAMEVD